MIPSLKLTLIFASIVAWKIIISSASPDPSLKPYKVSYKEDIYKDSSTSPISSKKYLEILEQIKVLESEIEDERTLRQTLQQQLLNASSLVQNNARNISVLSEKIKDVEESVDSDTNFWNSTDKCGGVIIAQSGMISSSSSSAYSSYRRLVITHSSSHSALRLPCVYTIRANYRSKIKIITTTILPNTYVTEYTLHNDGTHMSKQISLLPNQKYIFKGPVILLSTPARYSAGTITFEGHGKFVNQETEFRHYYFTGPIGTFDKKLNTSFVGFSEEATAIPKKRIFTTIVINTEKNNLAELEIVSPPQCNNSLLKIQKAMEPSESQANNSSCCLNDCPQTRHYTLDTWFAVSYSTLDPEINDDVKIKWISRWNVTDSINVCGGVLMGKTGKISYKKGINYENNERCVWVIYPFPKSQVRFAFGSGGLEYTYDHLTASEIDQTDGRALRANNLLESTSHSRDERDYKGRVVLLTFYTDGSIVRQGFEITWEAVGPSDYTRSLENEQIMHASGKNSNNMTIKRKTGQSKGFSLFVLNNDGMDASTLYMNMTVPVQTSITEDCNNNETTVGIFGSHNGRVFLHNTTWHTPCIVNTHNGLSMTSPDGLGYVLLKDDGIKKDVEIDIKWSYVPPMTEAAVPDDDVSNCGGALHGTTGKLTYKLEEVYNNNERCIWTILAPTSSKIELKLVKDGFESCCDYIMVNTINPENATVNKATTLITRENNTRIFDGPLLIVSFRTDSSVTGKGFSLQFIGRGTLLDNPYTYKTIHRNDPEGSFHYPLGVSISSNEAWNEEDDWDWLDELVNDEILVLSYSSGVEPDDSSISNNFNVSIEKIFLDTDDDCHSDRLNFYTAPSTQGFTLSESYPKMECTKSSDGTCKECSNIEIATNDTNIDGFGSPYRAFVAVYKPVQHEHDHNRSFQVHWESASGCGGVLEESSGKISYKLGGRYKNSEQCIWTIYSPLASKIRFTLQNHGFEPCCDFITLNSLNPEDGTISSATQLKTDITSATVDGPVVFVTFRSDASVTGEGFSLNFSTQVTSESPQNETYRYFNFHGRRRNSSFSYPVHSEGLRLGENDILTYTYSPELAKNDSYTRYGTKVDIEPIQLKFNNNTCASDILRVYSTVGITQGYNLTRSYEIDSPESMCQNATNDIIWNCNECSPDDTMEQLSLISMYPGFIAIYKSSTDDLSVGQDLHLKWTDHYHRGGNDSSNTAVTRIPPRTSERIRIATGRIGRLKMPIYLFSPSATSLQLFALCCTMFCIITESRWDTITIGRSGV